MNRMGRDFMTLIFPANCKLCGGARVRAESEICSTCLVSLPRERNYRGYKNNTTMRIRGMLSFERAFSFLQYSKKSAVQRLLHQVKYQGNLSLGLQLGKWFAAEVLSQAGHAFDIIVPVPLHRDKLKFRGYNQCLVIANGICQITGHKVIEALDRKHTATTQTQLSRWERFENTASEFSLEFPPGICNKRVLLLDDIITTGATISGSAIPLSEGGVSEIIVAAVALTQDI